MYMCIRIKYNLDTNFYL